MQCKLDFMGEPSLWEFSIYRVRPGQEDEPRGNGISRSLDKAKEMAAEMAERQKHIIEAVDVSHEYFINV